jgi:hypothetical protein
LLLRRQGRNGHCSRQGCRYRRAWLAPPLAGCLHGRRNAPGRQSLRLVQNLTGHVERLSMARTTLSSSISRQFPTMIRVKLRHLAVRAPHSFGDLGGRRGPGPSGGAPARRLSRLGGPCRRRGLHLGDAFELTLLGVHGFF